MMSFRPASFVALLVVAAVTMSAVQTCIPGVMARMAHDRKMADGQMTCHDGEGNHSFPVSNFHLSGSPTDCCKSDEPLVLTKSRSLLVPVRDILYWLTPAVLALMTTDPVISVPATGSPPVRDSVVGANTPRYVVLRTFRI